MKKGVVIAFLVGAFLVGVFIGVFYGNGITGAVTDPPFPFPTGSDEAKPTANIIAPTSGSTVSGQIVIRATAEDDDGIQKMEFLLDGVVEFTDTIPTAEGVYQWLLDTSTIANGQHTIGVAPHDTTGDFSDTTSVMVNVQNAGSAAGTGKSAPIQQQQQRVQLPPSQGLPTKTQPTRTAPAQPQAAPVQRPAVQPQSARPPVAQTQRAPAEVNDAPPTQAKYPLWLTLVASFGVIILVSGLLVFAIQRVRTGTEVPESIKTYVSVSMQQGYPVTGIHAALEQQGWSKRLIEEAFKDAIGEHLPVQRDR